MYKYLNYFYYLIKPIIPRRLQIFLRRKIVKYFKSYYEHIWPINYGLESNLRSGYQWPENKKFALILTHDVETALGKKNCLELMDIEINLGFHSSFNFVPERYRISPLIRETITRNGFEIGVHGLKHDGKLYWSKKIFEKRAEKINHYLKEWNAVGFRSPAMHHKLEWISKLDIAYDSSTFDFDPFEPQPDGIRSIYPFIVKNNFTDEGFVELPYTLAQDFTLFILLQEKTIDSWTNKLDWIVQQRGMALLDTHPDYMDFLTGETHGEKYPADLYKQFLNYVKEKYAGQYWNPLPREMAEFVRNHQSETTTNRVITRPVFNQKRAPLQKVFYLSK